MMDFEISGRGTLSAYNGKDSHVVIPDGVRSIDPRAFCDLDGVKSLTIPASCSGIINWAFVRDVPQLEAIEVDPGNPAYSSKDGVLYDKAGTTLLKWPGGKVPAYVPEGVWAIGKGAYEECKSLAAIEITLGVEHIASYAFHGCEALESVVIPRGVRHIGSFAFGGCESLRAVSIPRGVTAISDHVFSGCTSLEQVDIPSTVTSIGDYAFGSCRSLRTLAIPASVTQICEGAIALLDDVTLIVEQGSFAQGYAREQGIPYEVRP